MLTRLHNVYVRGVGFFGQLGLNNKYESAESFVPIPTLQRVELKELKGSYCQSLALVGNNELLVWGWPLDVRSQMQVLWALCDRPKLVKFIQRYSPLPWVSLREGIEIPEREVQIKDAIQKVDIGGAFIVACDDQGTVYGWGTSHRAQFGVSEYKYYMTPTVVGKLLGKKIVDVCCGYQHTLYLSSTGQLYGSGRCEYGTLGPVPDLQKTVYGHTTDIIEIPVTSVRAVAAGQNHTVVINDTGEVFAFGKNELGQCGDLSTVEKVKEPKKVYMPEKAKMVACGTKHTLILGESGTLYGMGGKRLGQLDGFRNGLTDEQCSPLPIKLPSDGKIQRIQAAFDRSCAFLDTGEVWVWGGDDFRYLGGEFYPDFTLLNDELPEEVTHGEITHVGLGFQHTLVGLMVQSSGRSGSNS